MTLTRPPGTLAEDVVNTLGPAGTDAHAEAVRLSARSVELFPSFRAAVLATEAAGGKALVATGYLDRDGTQLRDSWVDLHFTVRRSMRIADLWESDTKPMCVAVRDDLAGGLEAVRTVAAHPSTLQLVHEVFPADVAVRKVAAKPEAVRLVRAGLADACIASADIAKAGGLICRDEIHPSMVWCLYERR